MMQGGETVGRTVHCSCLRVGHGLLSSTTKDPCTWTSLSPGSCQRSLSHRSSAPAMYMTAEDLHALVAQISGKTGLLTDVDAIVAS